MVIDAHAHVIVSEITRAAAPDEGWRPAISWVDGKQVIDFAGKQIRAAVREFVDIETILEEQAASGVDRVVLAPWVSLLRYEVDPQEGLQTANLYNEGLARMLSAHPDRLNALGSVPLQDPKLAGRELETLMRTPGFVGVEIAASVAGVYLGAERFIPFWEAAESTGALVFVHPTTRGFDLSVMNDYYLWNAVGNPLETTIAAAHMVLAGVMESFPELKVLLAHGGGAIMGLRGRLRHAHSFQPQARERLRGSVDDSLKRFYYDTVVHDAKVLQQLVDYVGPKHVVLGSDYPFDMGDRDPAEIVRQLSLSPDEQAWILGRNAAQLCGLEEQNGQSLS